jgi:hypothetical protein
MISKKITMSNKDVAVYGCSECEYKTSFISNVNAHITRTCPSGERIIVKKMSIEQFLGDPQGGAGQGGAGQGDAGQGDADQGDAMTIQGHVVRPGPPPKTMFAKTLMRDVVDMQDIDEHLARLEGTDEGKEILIEILGLDDPIQMFLYFITYVIGVHAPPRYRSVAFLTSSKGKYYICWKAGSVVTVEDARRDTVFHFLKAAFVMFDKIMIERPLYAKGQSFLTRKEGEFLKLTFDLMEHKQPGRDTKKFKFQDFLLGDVRDPRITEELLLVKDSGIIPCIKIQHM